MDVVIALFYSVFDAVWAVVAPYRVIAGALALMLVGLLIIPK